MDYRQYKAPAVASSLGMARLNGSNRAAWNAMDLQIGRRPVTPTDRSHAAPQAVEDKGVLSARNILIRQKLRERKRYDSADEAMKKAAARSAACQEDPQQQPAPPQPPAAGVRLFSPAQMGQSAFFNAMGDGNTVMQEPTPVSIKYTDRQVQRNAPSVCVEPRGGAEQGRNVLIQHKLQTRTVFDSADYQLARLQRGGDARAQPPAGETETQDTDMGMEALEDDDVVARVSSPNAAAARRGQQFASMSPSGRRPGMYGALEDCKKPSRRDLLRQQLADKSLDAAGASPGSQPASSTANRDNGGEFAASTPGTSSYSKLSAQHVLIRRKLKERKRFDSADYAMKLQGQAPAEAPGDDAEGEKAVLTPVVGCYSALETGATSINHQVKHIKLSGEAHGRVATQSAASTACYGPLGPTTGPEQDSALAARNLVLQRKLAERKMFDSGDHFKAVGAAKKDAAAARSLLLQRSLQGPQRFSGGDYAGLVKKATSSG